MLLATVIAIALSCPTLPQSMLEIVVGNALHENPTLNERAVNHNSNGTDDFGLGQVNTINLDWTGLRGHEFEVCPNLTASAKVFLAKYNGNPPDQIKAVYAAAAMMQISQLHQKIPQPVLVQEKIPPEPAEPPPARPAQSGRDLLAVRQQGSRRQ